MTKPLKDRDGFRESGNDASVMTRPVRLQLSRRKGFNLQALSRATNGLPAVKVARPTKFGNWICAGKPGRLWISVGSVKEGLRTLLTADLPCEIGPETAARAYRTWIGQPDAPTRAATLTPWLVPGFISLDKDFRRICERELRRKRRDVLACLPALAGRNLACTCALGAECHADVLIEIANP